MELSSWHLIRGQRSPFLDLEGLETVVEVVVVRLRVRVSGVTKVTKVTCVKVMEAGVAVCGRSLWGGALQSVQFLDKK